MLKIDEWSYKKLESEIASDQSPVGIDAKKTHILILHKLIEIEKRLDRIEKGMIDQPSDSESS